MAALDFPNNPTVGQQWTGTNGALYSWDGAVWNISTIQPGTTAGGDLTGSYPNPSIAPNAVNRTEVNADCWLSPVPVAGDVGKVLEVTAGPALSWVALPAVGGSDGSLGTQTKYTTNVTLTTANQDTLIDCFFGNVQATLPAFNTNLSGKVFRLTRVDSTPANTATIMPAGADTIDGVNAFITLAVNESISLMACGTVANQRNWVRVSDTPWKTIQTGNIITPSDTVGGKVLVMPLGGNSIQWGGRTVKGRLVSHVNTDWMEFVSNGSIAAADASWTFDDATKSAWSVAMRSDATAANDSFNVYHGAAGASPITWTNYLGLDSNGNLIVKGMPATSAAGSIVLGTQGSTRGRVQTDNTGTGVGNWTAIASNVNVKTNTLDDSTVPGWFLAVQSPAASDNLIVGRYPAASSVYAQVLTVRSNQVQHQGIDGQGSFIDSRGGGSNNSGNFRGFSCAGTGSSPTPTTSGSELVRIAGFGCHTAGQNFSEQAYMAFKAAENWSAATRASQIWFYNTPAGSTSESNYMYLDQSGNFVISGVVGQKASGTTWANPSDPRLKTDVASYEKGLAEICALEPISYRLKAQSDGPLHYGFDASKVRGIFPECVSSTRMKLNPTDDEETDDVLVFDMHPILVALVNAIKELRPQ